MVEMEFLLFESWDSAQKSALSSAGRNNEGILVIYYDPFLGGRKRKQLRWINIKG